MLGGGKRLSGWAVFDLDGTLVDTVGEIAAALNRVLADEGRAPLSVPLVQELVGKGPRTLLERAWGWGGGAKDEKKLSWLTKMYLHEYQKNPRGMSRPFPGVEDGLRRLVQKGWRLGLCTNKDGRSAKALIRELGWDSWIRVVVSGDDGVRKPNARPLRLALHRLGAGLGRHLFIGDSEVDYQTARNAGVEAVFLGHGYGALGKSMGMSVRFFEEAVALFSWMARSGPDGALANAKMRFR